MKKIFTGAVLVSNVMLSSALTCVDITSNYSKGAQANSVIDLQDF